MAGFLIKSAQAGLQVHSLGQKSVSLGRHAGNEIVLVDKWVSRQHAHISCSNEHFHLEDTGSLYGTYVNGELLTGTHILADGDILTLGTSTLLFRLGEIREEDFERLRGHPLPQTPAQLPPEGESSGLDEQTIAYELPSRDYRTAEKLSGWRYECLTRVALTLQSTTDLDELLEVLLDAVFEVFQPDRGAILLCDESEQDFTVHVQRSEAGEVIASRTIIDYVATNQAAVMVTEIQGDARFAAARSVLAQSITAAICSPLVLKDRMLGVLYIDTQADLLSYSREDIALLSIISANAAMAIENANLLQQSQQKRLLTVDDVEPLVASSPTMRAVADRIPALARQRGPLLVCGEQGTGKYFITKQIHHLNPDPPAPFVTFDCAERVGQSAHRVLFGREGGPGIRGGHPEERSRDGALPRRPARPRQPEPQVTGENASLVAQAQGGTLVLRHVGALEFPAQRALCRYLAGEEQTEGDKPSPRIIMTTCEDLPALVAAERFHAPLAEILLGNTLELPCLQRRREDILPLAEYFLATCKTERDERPWRLTGSATLALGKLKYRDRNVAELRDAISLATVLADGPEISAEHLFTGSTDWSRRVELSLQANKVFRWLSQAWTTNLIQSSVLLLFGSMVIVCLLAGSTPVGELANALLWGFWWPALLALFLFLGRVWCYLCPIAKAGRLAQRIRSPELRPARLLKAHTSWLVALSLVVIVWCEHVFHMAEKPQATGVFLLSLFGITVVFGLLYKREAFCRYLCPLGNLSACYAVPSLLQVHANPAICTTQCSTHECYRGSESAAGCPNFHHPLYVRDAHFCKLCLQCLRSCPHGSARLYLRPPLRDLWALRDLSSTLAPTALVVVFLAPVMLASRAGLWRTADPLIYTGLVLACLGLALALVRFLPRVLTREGDPTTTTRVAFILALLAWGPLLAFHLGKVPGLDSLTISASTGSFWTEVVSSGDYPLLRVVQLGTIFAATLLATVALWRTWANHIRQDVKVRPIGWLVLAGLLILYPLLAASLVL